RCRRSTGSHQVGLIARPVHGPYHDQRIAIGIGDIHRDGHGLPGGRGAGHGDWLGTTDAGRGVVAFIRADVNHSSNDPRKAALVGRRSIGVVAGIDGWTAAEQRVCEGRPAVVLQRPQLKRRVGDVELIAGPRDNGTTDRANQVEAIRIRFSKLVIEQCNCAAVRSDNAVSGLHHTAEVENPSASIRKAAGNNVGSNGSVGHDQAAEAVKEAAAIGGGGAPGATGAATRAIATHGAAIHIYGAIIIGDAATFAGTATAAIAPDGGIAADRALVQRYRTKIVGNTATFTDSAVAASATPGDIATHGAVVQVHCAESVVDAAAESASVLGAAVGGIAVDDRTAERQCAIVVDAAPEPAARAARNRIIADRARDRGRRACIVNSAA